MDFEESLSEIQQIIYTNPIHHVDFLVKRHTLETIKGEKKFPAKECKCPSIHPIANYTEYRCTKENVSLDITF